jgi:hypothetical protein
VIGAAAARSEFARSVLDRHRRAAFADRQSLVLAAVRDTGTPAPAGCERVSEITIRERWVTPVWAPRIDVHLQAPARGGWRSILPAQPADPVVRILERVIRDDGAGTGNGSVPGSGSSAAPARAPRALPVPLMSSRVERVVVRDRASTPPSREPAPPARPQAPVAEPARRPGPHFTDSDVAQLTDRVMRSIDQRLRAYRERLGRA